MTKEELQLELKTAYTNYTQTVSNIHKRYALENNPYKIGDIVTDHFGPLKIEKITVNVVFGDPGCVYHGQRLTKTGEVKKRQDGPVFQGNIITT